MPKILPKLFIFDLFSEFFLTTVDISLTGLCKVQLVATVQIQILYKFFIQNMYLDKCVF